MTRVAILGAGSWGTALALTLSKKGVPAVLCARRREIARRLREEGENPDYLPGFTLPPELEVTSDISVAAGCEVLLFVVPSHGLRNVAEQIKQVTVDRGVLPKALISAAKGLENETLLTMTQVLEEIFPEGFSSRLAVLSGPSFAFEVARSLPTAVSLACTDSTLCTRLQELFSTPFFRVYSTSDVMGVQMGGAIKNVMAIASGISDGMGFGTNTRAALITRGLAEMSRLGVRMGANPLTFTGLAGLGDLVLTCTGDLSRNRQVGLRLGGGEGIDSILSSMNMVAEGVKTSKALYQLSLRHGEEMPITAQVYKVLYEGMEPEDAVRELLVRPLKQEFNGMAAGCFAG